MGYYVDISDVPLDFIEFMGYRVERQDNQYILLNHKGEQHIVLKDGVRYLHVEDMNDALVFQGRRRVINAPTDE